MKGVFERSVYASSSSIIRGMKSKTSVTLSTSLLEELDQVLGRNRNRSEFIEAAVREHLSRIMREQRDRRELELLNRNADALNKEAKDVLSYQVKL
jgi:metal-responsive CopG/Arc/MetJ family transcriptional regulator